MQVTCRLLNQETFTIDAEPSTTVGELKKKIEELKGDEFKSDTLKLIHSGKIWDRNEATLESENYKEAGFVVVMARKASVKPAETPKAPTESKAQPQTASQPAQLPTPPVVANPAPAAALAGPPQNVGFGISPDKYNEMVEAIVQMGYPKSEVESALRASYFNPERAVEYLISGLPPVSGGIPPAVLSGNPAGAAQRPAQAAQPVAEAGAAAGGADPLAFFRDSPQFAQMRQMIQQDPQLLRNFMQDISQANPQLMQAIRDHEEEFLAMLNTEAAEGDEEYPEGLEGLQAALGGLANAGGAPPPGVHYVNVTPEENAAIERLKAMGFPEQMVIEAFFACDKNEEMAANFLLSNLDELDPGRGL
ncbi:UV excision repair protein RAD23 homolog B-like [Paramacrobiotus metropolitanus]|uniref:UV excision repair protein RAD23 homolog B-like n=1 Tax=Paramacrobiotus metropolitanus TaxID=2943436 RepID=UPI0024465884|nr:UV excision repair protein RAD23 homolog B-like [Paramacrobiotus metropolitanus]